MSGRLGDARGGSCGRALGSGPRSRACTHNEPAKAAGPCSCPHPHLLPVVHFLLPRLQHKHEAQLARREALQRLPAARGKQDGNRRGVRELDRHGGRCSAAAAGTQCQRAGARGVAVDAVSVGVDSPPRPGLAARGSAEVAPPGCSRTVKFGTFLRSLRHTPTTGGGARLGLCLRGGGACRRACKGGKSQLWEPATGARAIPWHPCRTACQVGVGRRCRLA